MQMDGPVQILPDVSSWAYNGTAELRGETAHVWVFEQRCTGPAMTPCFALHDSSKDTKSAFCCTCCSYAQFHMLRL